MHLSVISSSEQFITVEVLNQGSNKWLFSAVYASPHDQYRETFWEDMSTFNQLNTLPWLLAGDFNETRSMSERVNCGEELQCRCTNFNNWINNNSFHDLGFSGPQFTWYRGKRAETRKAARLERDLGNLNWRMNFADAGVKNLVQNHSDHCPLLISVLVSL